MSSFAKGEQEVKSKGESRSVTLKMLIRFQSDSFTTVAEDPVSNVAFTATPLSLMLIRTSVISQSIGPSSFTSLDALASGVMWFWLSIGFWLCCVTWYD
jgi:hypothetical protein